MTPADLIEAAAKLGLDTIVDALSGHGISVPDELRERAEKALQDLLGPGVTDARRLVVDDTRPAMRQRCTSCGWLGPVNKRLRGIDCPGCKSTYTLVEETA